MDKIISVERESDGEIFTVGDRIMYGGTIRSEILRFEVVDDVIKAIGDDYHLTLDNIILVNEYG